MKKELILAISMAIGASTGFAADNSATGSAGASSSGMGGMGTASGSMSNEGANASASADMEKFAKLDKNKDGMLSKSEIKKDKKLKKQFDRADTDKDGNISQAEYQAIATTSAGSGSTGGTSQPDSSKDYNLGGSNPSKDQPGNYGDPHTTQGSGSSSTGGASNDGPGSGGAAAGSGSTGSTSGDTSSSGTSSQPNSAEEYNLGGSDPSKDKPGNFGDPHTERGQK